MDQPCDSAAAAASEDDDAAAFLVSAIPPLSGSGSGCGLLHQGGGGGSVVQSVCVRKTNASPERIWRGRPHDRGHTGRLRSAASIDRIDPRQLMPGCGLAAVREGVQSVHAASQAARREATKASSLGEEKKKKKRDEQK